MPTHRLTPVLEFCQRLPLRSKHQQADSRCHRIPSTDDLPIDTLQLGNNLSMEFTRPRTVSGEPARLGPTVEIRTNAARLPVTADSWTPVGIQAATVADFRCRSFQTFCATVTSHAYMTEILESQRYPNAKSDRCSRACISTCVPEYCSRTSRIWARRGSCLRSKNDLIGSQPTFYRPPARRSDRPLCCLT